MLKLHGFLYLHKYLSDALQSCNLDLEEMMSQVCQTNTGVYDYANVSYAVFKIAVVTYNAS